MAIARPIQTGLPQDVCRILQTISPKVDLPEQSKNILNQMQEKCMGGETKTHWGGICFPGCLNEYLDYKHGLLNFLDCLWFCTWVEPLPK